MIALTGPRCPTCGNESLTAMESGRLVCTNGHCSRPGAAQLILSEATPHHTATIGAADFSLTHPLIERLGDQLHDCALTKWLRGLDGPPGTPGKYRVRWADGWLFERIDVTDDGGGRIAHAPDAAERAAIAAEADA